MVYKRKQSTRSQPLSACIPATLLPNFKLHNLLFKIAYTLGARRQFLLTGERDATDRHQLCVDLGNCGSKLVEAPEIPRRR